MTERSRGIVKASKGMSTKKTTTKHKGKMWKKDAAHIQYNISRCNAFMNEADS